MGKVIAAIAAFIGTSVATLGTTGCTWLIIDEPKMPKSMLKK